MRNLSLVYPAVTLCYKNEDQQGYKLNVLKVVKTIDRTSFVVISLRNSISLATGKTVQVFIKLKFRISQRQTVLGDYRNDTWEGFNWGEESLERLWQEATYDVSLSTKLTTTYKYTRSTQVGLSLCMKCEEKMICSPGSHSRAVRHFEQPDDRAPPLEHDHRRLSQSKCVCSWTQVSWNKMKISRSWRQLWSGKESLGFSLYKFFMYILYPACRPHPSWQCHHFRK